jgi:hypothetical protein
MRPFGEAQLAQHARRVGIGAREALRWPPPGVLRPEDGVKAQGPRVAPRRPAARGEAPSRRVGPRQRVVKMRADRRPFEELEQEARGRIGLVHERPLAGLAPRRLEQPLPSRTAATRPRSVGVASLDASQHVDFAAARGVPRPGPRGRGRAAPRRSAGSRRQPRLDLAALPGSAESGPAAAAPPVGAPRRPPALPASSPHRPWRNGTPRRGRATPVAGSSPACAIRRHHRPPARATAGSSVARRAACPEGDQRHDATRLEDISGDWCSGSVPPRARTPVVGSLVREEAERRCPSVPQTWCPRSSRAT